MYPSHMGFQCPSLPLFTTHSISSTEAEREGDKGLTELDVERSGFHLGLGTILPWILSNSDNDCNVYRMRETNTILWSNPHDSTKWTLVLHDPISSIRKLRLREAMEVLYGYTAVTRRT